MAGKKKVTRTNAARPVPRGRGERAVTDAHIEMIRESALRRAALVAGFNTDLMALEEIEGSLRESAPAVHGPLQTFLDALDAWHQFHNRVLDHQGNLTAEERHELSRRTRAKDAARATFAALTEIPSPELGRSWIIDSLQPIRDQLTVGIPRLESCHFAWRFHLDESEVFSPLSSLAGTMARSPALLLRQFQATLREYDAGLAHLMQALRAGFEAILGHAPFMTVVTQAITAHREQNPSDTPWGSWHPDRIHALSAEFVLNHVEEVFSGTSTMERFWRGHGISIRAAVPAAILAPSEHAARDLLVIARRLEGSTQTLADRLGTLCGFVRSTVPFYPEQF